MQLAPPWLCTLLFGTREIKVSLHHSAGRSRRQEQEHGKPLHHAAECKLGKPTNTGKEREVVTLEQRAKRSQVHPTKARSWLILRNFFADCCVDSFMAPGPNSLGSPSKPHFELSRVRQPIDLPSSHNSRLRSALGVPIINFHAFIS